MFAAPQPRKEVILEVTQIGKESHSWYTIRRQIGQCIPLKEGAFTKVTRGGTARVGNIIRIEKDGSREIPNSADYRTR